MSILSNIISLFSGAPRAELAAAVASEPEMHADCLIFAAPIKDGAQYRLAGRIEKQVGDETLVRTFIRADVFSSADEAQEFTVKKARQIIDQNGAGLFGDGEKQRQV